MQIMAHSATLLASRVVDLQRTNEALSQHRKCQKRHIKKKGSLTIAEGQDLVDQNSINDQIRGETRMGNSQVGPDAPARRRCGRCRQIGHRIETCPERLSDIVNISV